jgi:hypothetical protein
VTATTGTVMDIENGNNLTLRHITAQANTRHRATLSPGIAWSKQPKVTTPHSSEKYRILGMILGAKFHSWANFPWFFQKQYWLF